MAGIVNNPKSRLFVATLAGTLLLWNTGCTTKVRGVGATTTSTGSNGLHPALPQPSTPAPDAAVPDNATSAFVRPDVENALVAVLLESGAQKYASLDIRADGTMHGTRFSTRESMDIDHVPRSRLGSLVADANCSAVEAPPLPTVNTESRVHVLSSPRSCAKLQLLPRESTQVSLQWYGIEPNDRGIAVLRPVVASRNSWILVIADSLLSPAGPWLAVQTKDLDGDGMRDVAFVSQGVDGCDRGPCPLFWINLLLSHTHTIVRSGTDARKQGFEATVLLDTLEFEERTGLDYARFSPSRFTWQSHAEKGRYQVSLNTGRRTLTFTALIGGNEIVVKRGAALN